MLGHSERIFATLADFAHLFIPLSEAKLIGVTPLAALGQGTGQTNSEHLQNKGAACEPFFEAVFPTLQRHCTGCSNLLATSAIAGDRQR